jgi:hypothetical protein
MKTKILLTSCVFVMVLLPSRAAISTNAAPAEGVTVETGGEKLDALKETPAERDARMKLWREAIIPWAGRVTDAIDGTAMEVDYVRIYRRKP